MRTWHLTNKLFKTGYFLGELDLLKYSNKEGYRDYLFND